jgi:hypothetical protein
VSDEATHPIRCGCGARFRPSQRREAAEHYFDSGHRSWNIALTVLGRRPKRTGHGRRSRGKPLRETMAEWRDAW